MRPAFFTVPARALVALVALSLAALRAAEPANSGAAPHLARPALAPAAAAAALQLPPGFRADLFAAEPDIQNPIASAWDARGRLWVAENYTYSERGVKFDLRYRDRLVVFTPAPSPAAGFSRRTVFPADFQKLTSVEIGHGGVWVMCPPQLLFIPDRDADLVPDGPAEVILDGFTVPAENYHNFANGLRFGPDGWLYGRCGASAPGELGAPGTPAADRIPLRGTLWRYHPVRRTVEVLSTGTTNPWGHDWDDHGELFFINTVNGHLWHQIPGAHYVRAHTLDPNPHVYALIDQHADHWHFDTAQDWTKSRDGAANAHGGGHAHVGMTIYLGDQFPADYRGRLFTLNFHGRRANTERLERRGSGYVGRHAPDFFLSSDPWFRGQELTVGPDGSLFVLDWSDTGECHNHTGVNRLSGRIYQITYAPSAATLPSPTDLPATSESARPSAPVRAAPPAATSPLPSPIATRPSPPPDLAAADAPTLLALLSGPNAWPARQALLQFATRPTLRSAAPALRDLLASASPAPIRLRALWALHALGLADEPVLLALLADRDEHLRTWSVRLLADAWPLDTVLSRRPARPATAPSAAVLAAFARQAAADTSGLVRLALASALQRLPVAARPALAAPLLRRAEDAADHNLPLLLWYGLIPVAAAQPAALADLAADCALPATRRLIARRLAEDLATAPAPLDRLLASAATADRPDALRADLLAGLAEGLRGWRRATPPAAWPAFAARLAPAAAADPALAARLRDLQVLFGDGRSLDEVRKLVLDGSADIAARSAALRTLIAAAPPDLRAVCESVLRVRFLNTVAAAGLARFDDPALGEKLARSYSSFHPSERPALIETLVARPAFARALLAEIAAGRLPREAITPFHVRQIRSFGDPALDTALAAAWGELRESAADKRALIARLRAELTPAVLAAADKSAGRAVFARLCAACHTLYGEGGNLGPDLTGAGRDNLDYLLENIVDPGAVVTADYRMTVVKLKDGRTLNGFIAARTTRTLTVRSPAETVTVERADIAALEESPHSVMPEGLLESLPPEETRALLAYLAHPVQVPLR
jgi:putative membrane-bound dehydrogenase-like protein